MFLFFNSGVKCKMFRRKNLISQSLLLLATFSSVVFCDDSFGMKLTTESSKAKAHTGYSFHYFVKDDKTGDYKTQNETRQGNSVQGSYTLAEPNGDLRTVTYKAGPGTGFEAKVDVQTSASPMKQTTDATTDSTLGTTKVERATTLESNVNHFPGGFEMGISSKPLDDVKTEMGMKFSLKTNTITEPVTISTKAAEFVENQTTEKPVTAAEEQETTSEEITTANLESSAIENSTFPTEGRDISEDPIEKEIDEAINSMPKLPELVLSDNKTHFKFHKDPEEALLDERITQIARQLAETSLRREYEERKLGHFIPISVSSIEPAPETHLSKSFKFTRNDPTSSPSTLNVVTQVRLVPQYIYGQTLTPQVPQVNNRLQAVGKTGQQPQPWGGEDHESITNPPDILKISKSEINKINKVKEKKFSTGYKATDKEPTAVMPIHVPTLLQFITPYVMDTTGTYTPQKKSTTTTNKDVTTGATPAYYDTTLYTPAKADSDKITKKF